MSNHSGSYMLNEIIGLLVENQVFASLKPEKMRRLIVDIIKISRNYDCNPGEILEGYGERFGICHCCLKQAEEFEMGLCPNCGRLFGLHTDEEHDGHFQTIGKGVESVG